MSELYEFFTCSRNRKHATTNTSRVWLFLFICNIFFIYAYSYKITFNPFEQNLNIKPILKSIAIISIPLYFSFCENSNAISLQDVSATISQVSSSVSIRKLGDISMMKESPGLKLARQKRTMAIKALENKGVLKIDTDDIGNQFLYLPWLPNQKILYKSIPINMKLWNELCSGALGELSKDVMLHAVDTIKTRKQSQKAKDNANSTISTSLLQSDDSKNPLLKIKDLYAGFPVVLASSLPQGGTFFLVKKGLTELINLNLPTLPKFVSSTIPIGFGVAFYWLFRTPAEVIKTQVQTSQYPNVMLALKDAKTNNPNGFIDLWKYYPVVLGLDIPFQIINFILFSTLTDLVMNAGFEQSILTRLFCGVTCGMIAAGLTCPLDVGKTRIIARDREAMKQRKEIAANNSSAINIEINKNIFLEIVKIFEEEGFSSLFLGLQQRLLYTGFANGIRLAAYGTSRMDLMLKSFDSL